MFYHLAQCNPLSSGGVAKNTENIAAIQSSLKFAELHCIHFVSIMYRRDINVEHDPSSYMLWNNQKSNTDSWSVYSTFSNQQWDSFPVNISCVKHIRCVFLCQCLCPKILVCQKLTNVKVQRLEDALLWPNFLVLVQKSLYLRS